MYQYNRTAKQKAYESSIQSACAGNIIPVLAYAKITRTCNLSCGYCVEEHMLTHNDMGLEEWKKAADTAYMLGNRSISLVGGEPLLSPYVLDLVDYISRRDTFVGITTNGLCLNESLLHSLDEAGLDNIGFSIDTIEDSGQPPFGKKLTPELAEILTYITRSKFRFKAGVAAVVTRYNLDMLPEMLHRFSALGVPVRFTLMVRGVINQGYTENLALGEKDLKKVEQIFSRLFDMKTDGYLLGNEDYFKTRLKPKMGFRTPAKVYQMYMGDSSSHSCKGGIYDLPMDNDGRLGTCCTGLTSSTHISDIASVEDYHAYIRENKKTTDLCPGCPWPHKWILTHLKETKGFMKS